MREEILTVGARDVLLLLPDGEYDTLLYANSMSGKEYREVYGRFENPGFALAVILDTEWFTDLTPWYEPTVFPAGPDFAGKAPEHLEYLTQRVIPAVEEKLGVPQFRGIMGFSLGGLFAVYALYSSDRFVLCGCPSGSMWYDGFLDWMKQRKPGVPEASIYFSVGDVEHLTKFTRMQTTGERMKEACALLNAMDYDACFKYTKGDHMDDVPGKLEKCLRWLMNE